MADGADMLSPGSMIGDRHRVVRLLGKGGMGAVYEAENTWTKRRVAVKMLLPMFSSDSTAVARFQGEAQAATQLAHPNIVDVLDMGQDAASGALYIVQEFLRGRDLHEHLEERKQLAPCEAADILVPVMGALALAHERNIIHRDLKPENIFLVTSGAEMVPKLIDFGLSKVLGEDGATRKTVTGTVMGTPYYMSPEQARGDRAVDARTDIWAMGAVLFEMVCGRLPYEADSATMILMQIITKPPPRVEEVAPEVPAEVAAIVHRAMEPDLSKRYATMREMLDDVLGCRWFQNPDQRALLRERFARSIEHKPPVDVASPDAFGSTMMAVPAPQSAPPVRPLTVPPATAPATSLDSWQSKRADSAIVAPRRPALFIAVAAVLVLVGVGLGAVFMGRTPAASDAPAAPMRVAAQVPSPQPTVVVAAPTRPTVEVDASAPGLPSSSGLAPTTPTETQQAAVAEAQEPRSGRRSSRHHSHRNHGNDLLAPVAPR